MKRRDDRDHVSRESYEAQGDDEEEDDHEGGFQRASADVLATRRKIVPRTKRTNDSSGAAKPSMFGNVDLTSSLSAPKPSPFGNIDLTSSSASKPSDAAKPFAGFNGLAPSTNSLNSFQPPSTSAFPSFAPSSFKPPATVNDTTNKLGSFLAPSPSSSSALGSGLGSFSSSSLQASKSAPSIGSSIAPIGSGVGFGDESEYTEKLRKLNMSFFEWVKRQMKDKPVSLWKEGLKDYTKYSAQLAEEASAFAPSAVAASASDATTTKKAVDFAAKAPTFAPAPAVETKPQPPVVAELAKPSTTTPMFSFSVAPALSAPASSATPAAVAQPFMFGGTAAPTTLATTTTTAASSVPAFSFAPKPSASTGTMFGSGASNPFSMTGNLDLGAATKPAAASSFNMFPSGTGSSFGTATGTSAFTFGAGTSAPAAAAAGGGGGGDEDGGDEPLLAPEKVLKNDKDTDEILHEVPCKVRWLCTEDKDWKDCGKGTLRITMNPESKKQRILARNEMGKITLNCGFRADMKFESKQKGVMFNAFVNVEESRVDPATNKQIVSFTAKIRQYLVTLKPSDIPATMDKLNAGIASL